MTGENREKNIVPEKHKSILQLDLSEFFPEVKFGELTDEILLSFPVYNNNCYCLDQIRCHAILNKGWILFSYQSKIYDKKTGVIGKNLLFEVFFLYNHQKKDLHVFHFNIAKDMKNHYSHIQILKEFHLSLKDYINSFIRDYDSRKFFINYLMEFLFKRNKFYLFESNHHIYDVSYHIHTLDSFNLRQSHKVSSDFNIDWSKMKRSVLNWSDFEQNDYFLIHTLALFKGIDYYVHPSKKEFFLEDSTDLDEYFS